VVALPALCLAAARWMVEDHDRLDLLVGHQGTVVVPPSDDWQALGAIETVVGNLDATVAMLAAVDTGAFVMTGRAGLYRGLTDGGPIVEI
jgi:hypothetical protein